MIITAPTALYNSILPKATTPGNVTFTISSNDPPRTQSFVSQLSSAADYQDLPTRVYTSKERRASLGNLIFSVSYGAKGPAGFGQKMFEVGQTLNFDEDTTTDLAEVQVSNNLDLQQNLNLLNLEAMGLTNDQIARLIDTSNEQFNKLVVDLNVAFTNINNAKTAISDNQKKINETGKAVDASKTVYVLTGQGKDILDSLTATKAGLEQTKVDLIAYYNEQVVVAELIVSQILNVREVVR